MGLNHSTIN